MDQSIRELLKFLTPPKGSGPEVLIEKIKHYIAVCNHPEQFSADRSPYAVAAKRRGARQNIRRLLKSHPELASVLMQPAPGDQR